jgi:hypothetical protein
MPQSYSIGESAGELGARAQTVKRWCRNGDIKYTRTPGREQRIPHRELRRRAGDTCPTDRVALYARVSEIAVQQVLLFVGECYADGSVSTVTHIGWYPISAVWSWTPSLVDAIPVQSASSCRVGAAASTLLLNTVPVIRSDSLEQPARPTTPAVASPAR